MQRHQRPHRSDPSPRQPAPIELLPNPLARNEIARVEDTRAGAERQSEAQSRASPSVTDVNSNAHMANANAFALKAPPDQNELAFPDYSNSAQPSPERPESQEPVPPASLSPGIVGSQSSRISSTLPLINAPPTISEPLVDTPAVAGASVEDPSSSVSIPHFRNVWSTSSMASSFSPAGSAVSSPALAAMSDLTPLPSPLLGDGNSPPWKRSQPSRTRSGSAETALLPDQVGQSRSRNNSSPSRKKYGSLTPAALDRISGTSMVQALNKRSHSRNRSLSEYLPEPIQNVRPRHVTLGEKSQGGPPVAAQMQRETYLAEERGLAVPSTSAPKMPMLPDPSLPTPPPSNKSATESEGEDVQDSASAPSDLLNVNDAATQRVRSYRPVRLLGQGTFSKVILATSDSKYCSSSIPVPDESALNPRTLVAVKVVEHGPAGGANEERVELGLHREVETLLSLEHPSLAWIRAFDLAANPALLVLNYCPGGDLFDLAARAKDALCPGVVARIMAELVDAVRYLHSQWIAHRDIKLENVLVNLLPSALLSPSKEFLASLPINEEPIVTLTDLGLCKKIPQPPNSPELRTRCGSEDYAAPEILLGQPYDGRATDAWALGVLLYALMEQRLPFDLPPGHKGRKGRPAHRIARCEWVWSRFGDEDGDWDPKRAGPEWDGAREVVAGLLKKVSRGRASLDQVAEMPWIKNAIQVPLKRAVDEEAASQGKVARLKRPTFTFVRRETKNPDSEDDEVE